MYAPADRVLPQEPGQNLEMSLREHLLQNAGPAASGPNSPYPSNVPSASAPAHGADLRYQSSGSTSPRDHLDPHAARSQQMAYAMGGDSGPDDMNPDTAKGKRELSTSKRAAQNRAAQRAFRQRKEGYIKKLEEQVKEFGTMEQNYRSLQNENYQLREYILNLQSRLLENQSDIPPPPLHVNLSGSSAAVASSNAAPETHRGADLQARRELPRHETPTPVMRGQDPMRRGAYDLPPEEEEGRPRDSTYGLGADYGSKRLQSTEASLDGKSAS